MKTTYALLLSCLLVATITQAQKKKSSAGGINSAAGPIQSKIAGLKAYLDILIYYDEKQDKILLLIDKLDTEFLYVSSLPAGVGSNDIGLDRGQLGNERIVKFDRRGPKVLLIEPNYRYRAITDNADERTAVQEAFAQSVLWGFKVEAEEGEGRCWWTLPIFCNRMRTM